MHSCKAIFGLQLRLSVEKIREMDNLKECFCVNHIFGITKLHELEKPHIYILH